MNGSGFWIGRGDYSGTTDNRLDRWYINPDGGPSRRFGQGYATWAEALEALAQILWDRGDSSS